MHKALITSVIVFWRDIVGPEHWFSPQASLDLEIRKRFEHLWRKARIGALDDWEETPEGALALILVLDQFPRGMFRGTPDAWLTDDLARGVAERAVARGDDLAIEGLLRQFFYMPYLHAEELRAQERGLALIEERMPGGHLSDARADARARQMVIRRFGRFPWRNDLVGRRSSDEEAAFLWAGGYDWALRRHAKTGQAA